MKEHLRPDYNDFTATDFALDELFVKWVNRNDSETDRFWREWLVENPAKRQEVETARALVLALRFEEEEISQTEIKAQWFKLQTRQEEEGPLLVARSNPSAFYKFLRVAAVVLLAVGSSFILNKLPLNASPETIQIAEHRTPKGQKLSVVLPDGTSIILNSGSTIQYPAAFSESSREIDLEGEAFFDVVHDPDRPFNVRTHGITTSVLGTTFNVKAYSEDRSIEVALVAGRVRIDGVADSTASGVFLEPSQMITIDKRANTHEINSFKPIEVVGWKDGILYFDRVSFPDAIARLERWYGVDISVMPGVKLDTHWRFNGKFHGQTLNQILKVFSYPDLFKYRVDRDSVVINGSGDKKYRSKE